MQKIGFKIKFILALCFFFSLAAVEKQPIGRVNQSNLSNNKLFLAAIDGVGVTFFSFFWQYVLQDQLRPYYPETPITPLCIGLSAFILSYMFRK